MKRRELLQAVSSKFGYNLIAGIEQITDTEFTCLVIAGQVEIFCDYNKRDIPYPVFNFANVFERYNAYCDNLSNYLTY